MRRKAASGGQASPRGAARWGCRAHPRTSVQCTRFLRGTARDNLRQPSTGYTPTSPCLQPATPHLGLLCHHLGCTVPRGRQGPREGMQPGEQRLAVPMGSQGKKHGVWHKVSPSPQESLSCNVTAAFTLSCKSFLGYPAPYARGKYLHLPQEGLYAERSRMGLTIPILSRDRVQNPDTLQQPSPGYEGSQVPAEGS